jgi:hypothetical protein
MAGYFASQIVTAIVRIPTRTSAIAAHPAIFAHEADLGGVEAEDRSAPPRDGVHQFHLDDLGTIRLELGPLFWRQHWIKALSEDRDRSRRTDRCRREPACARRWRSRHP